MSVLVAMYTATVSDIFFPTWNDYTVRRSYGSRTSHASKRLTSSQIFGQTHPKRLTSSPNLAITLWRDSTRSGTGHGIETAKGL
jgi:hypothetical protein